MGEVVQCLDFITEILCLEDNHLCFSKKKNVYCRTALSSALMRKCLYIFQSDKLSFWGNYTQNHRQIDLLEQWFSTFFE